MAYADITTGDPNPVKRWLHRRRYADAVSVLVDAGRRDRPRILDFGAGNGELVRQINAVASVEALVYEPAASLMAEAKEKLAGMQSVQFTETLASVEPATFDYVFCLEVFEHLPARQSDEAIASIDRMLKPGGIAVIGVPHEIHLPALLKGLFRMCRRYGDFDARMGNIWAAARGRPPASRPVAEISPGVPFHFHHLGFDYRMLEAMLRRRFQLVERWFSPLPVAGALLNSEVYFLLQKARNHAGAA
jgi:SAM-dependent methyltransferase